MASELGHRNRDIFRHSVSCFRGHFYHYFPACRTTVNISGWFYVVGLGIVPQIILVQRTYAICGRSKRILAGILCSEFGCLGAAAYFVNRFSKPFFQTKNPFPDMITDSMYTRLTCGVLGPQLWLGYLFLLIDETIIMTVTVLYVYWVAGKPSGSPLIRIIYRDGISFYIFLQIFSLINIIIYHVSPPLLKGSFVSVHRVIHALFTARIVLNIREAVYRNTGSSTMGTLTWEAAAGTEMFPVAGKSSHSNPRSTAMIPEDLSVDIQASAQDTGGHPVRPESSRFTELGDTGVA